MHAQESTPKPAREWKHYSEPAWVEVDGVSAAYRRKGEGPPLLFLHGTAMTRNWLPFYEELAGAFDVIVPEHPGFGDTAMPPWLDGFDDLVLHYDGLLRALGVDEVHLVGHSLGGWIAADLAVFYPERFPTLTLMSPTGLRLPEEVAIRDVFRLGDDAFDVYFNGRAEEFAEYAEQEGGLDDIVHAYGEGITLARLGWNPRYDWRLDHRLGRVRARTLVLAPEEDRLIPAEMSARYAELIPGASLGTISGANAQPSGHLAHVEHPGAVARLVRDHIQEEGTG